MKKTFLITAVAAIAALLAASCSKEDGRKPAKRLECTAAESYNVAATGAKSVSFDITSNTPWTVRSSATWCKASPESSAESSLSETVIVKLDDNTASAPREAVLTIEGEGIEKPVLVKIIQDMPGRITVTPFTETFAKEGGVQEFTVVSNKAWTVTASPSGWLTFEPSAGEASEQPVTVKATARYTDGKGHTATVTVSSVDDSKSFEASIEGVVFEIEELEDGAQVFDRNGGAKEIKVDANIDWNVSVSDSFFSAEKTEVGFKVVAPMSKWFGKRAFNVTVTPEAGIDGLEAKVLEMSIAPASYIDNSDESAYTVNGDGSLTLTMAEKGNAFVKTFDTFTYGNFVWEFSDVNLSEGFFSVNNWNGPLYLMLQYGFGKAQLATGGTVDSTDGHKACFGFDGGWDNGGNDTQKFTEGSFPADMSQLKSIRLLIKPTKRTGTNQNFTLSRKVWINGKPVLDNSANVGDVWAANPETAGLYYLTGIQDAVGSLTVKSFEIDTDYSKYADD